MLEDEVKLLTIKVLQPNDSGAYLCRVLNEYGYSDLIHHLNVLPGMHFVYHLRRKIHDWIFRTTNVVEQHTSTSLSLQSITG